MVVRLYLLLAVQLFLLPTTSPALEINHIGDPALEGIGNKQSPTEIEDWNNRTPIGILGKAATRLLTTPIGDSTLNSRGVQDIEVYRTASPSVVIVQSDAGNGRVSIGSGSYIGSNQILTNAHVVGSNQFVLIAFKPAGDGVKINPSGVIIGHVLQVDRIRDLALVRVNSTPMYVHPLPLGNDSNLQVGADVYAIGHPVGEEWTFTRGLISQIRRGYIWKDENGSHKADVIQTQTPINVGNSGGPLIDATGKLIGVNSFKRPGAEGINFAVAVKDVTDFMSRRKSQSRPKAALKCKAVKLYDGRNKSNDEIVRQLDTNCDGRADVFILIPDVVSKPVQAFFDTNHDNRFDVLVNDYNRDGLWDVSFYDTNFDGKTDLVGYHPDGGIAASRYETYDATKNYAQYRGKKIVGMAK